MRALDTEVGSRRKKHQPLLQGEEEEVQGMHPCAKELSAPVVICQARQEGLQTRGQGHGQSRPTLAPTSLLGLLEASATKAAPCGPLGIF